MDMLLDLSVSLRSLPLTEAAQQPKEEGLVQLMLSNADTFRQKNE